VSIVLVLLFGKFLELALTYFERTKFTEYRTVLYGLIFLFFLGTSVYPAFAYAQGAVDASFDDDVIDTYTWLQNTPEGSVIAAPLPAGHLVTALGKRANVMDTDYLLIRDVDQRFQDLQKMYTTVSITEALRLFEKYDVDYIVSPIPLQYINDACFDKVYSTTLEVYEIKCGVEEQ